MILSDRELLLRLDQGDLEVAPLKDRELQIQPASIDLRLHNDFIVYRSPQVACLDPRDPVTLEQAAAKIHVADGDGFILHPGEFSLGSTLERVRIPNDLVARVDGRSSIGRLAIVVHATAGFIDPGFNGQITLELSNIGRIPVKLYPGMRIAQIVLYQMTSAAERPYGKGRGSHYQDQVGPRVSRVGVE